MTEEYEQEFQDSGPFCQHWAELGDCDQICKRCGHTCGQHPRGDGCWVNDCDCEGFEDKQRACTP